MPAHLDVEKDDARFLRNFLRVLMVFVFLMFIFLAGLTYAILKDNPSYMHDWRGVTCIVLATVAFLLYALPTLFGFFWSDWPPPLPYALCLWGGLYLVVCVLTLINNSFLWAFYAVFAISFALFGGRRVVIAVAIMALTLFAFEGDI